MREYSVPEASAAAPVNLTHAVWRNAEAAPNAVVALVNGQGGVRKVTASEFRDEVTVLAKGLITSGVQPGQRVALMSRTRYEWTLADYAIWAAGAVTVPIYPTSSVNQTHWILADSGAVGCLVEDVDQLRMVRGLAEQLPELRHLWLIDGEPVDEATGGPRVAPLSELTAGGATGDDAELNRRRTERGPDDLATIIYTSGTTGRPQGCRILHRNFGYGVANGMTVLPQAFNADASTLLYLPLAHVLAREIQCGAIETRTAISYTPDTARLLDDLSRFSPTTLLVIPRVLERLWSGARQKALEAKKGRIFDAAAKTAVAYSEAADTGSIGFGLRAKHALFNVLIYRKLREALGGRCSAVISGGAPLSTRLGRFFHGAGIEIYEGYGLTETSAACSVNNPRERKFGTVGRPLPGVSMRIADDGEILVKGNLVFDGYWNNPEATAAVMRGGWLHTGDLGALDADGYLAITGRKKELIITSSGKNVVPAPMEEALRAHPLVSQCVVIGDNRPFISCLITLDPNGLTAWRSLNPSSDNADDETAVRGAIQEAVDEVNATVSRAEAIKVFHILPDDFTVEDGELTPSLKIRKSVVTDHYANEIAAMYG